MPATSATTSRQYRSWDFPPAMRRRKRLSEGRKRTERSVAAQRIKNTHRRALKTKTFQGSLRALARELAGGPPIQITHDAQCWLAGKARR